MATKCIVLGFKYVPSKPIEFAQLLTQNLTLYSASSEPKAFQNIELICKNYRNMKIDLMFAYNEDRSCGILYIGNWNDGIV